VDAGEQVCADEADSMGELVAGAVVSGEGEGLLGDVCCDDLGVGQMAGESHRDCPASGAYVEGETGTAATRDSGLRQHLGLGARDNGVGCDAEGKGVELGLSEEVG
jgi:hypothetical protein